MKLFHTTCMCMLAGVLMLGAANSAKADEWNKKTYVTTSQSIEVPGAILPPGKYVFKLVDSASNRHIVRVTNAEENHVFSTILAIPKQRTEPSGKTLITFYEMRGGGPEPVRSWFYPGDTIGQEFAYPKERASEIANATRENVPVAPMGTATPEEAPAPAPTTVAANPTPEPSAPATVAEEPAPALTPSPSEDATPMEPAPVDQAAPPPPAQEPAPAPASTPPMPQTAGNTAAIGLAGLGCLIVAISLRAAAAARS